MSHDLNFAKTKLEVNRQMLFTRVSWKIEYTVRNEEHAESHGFVVLISYSIL